jgi:hypothetical protein
MAIIYSYPEKQPKLEDLIVFTEAAVGNPTKSTTLSGVQSIIAPNIVEGTANNMAMFSTTNKVVDASPVSMIQSTVNGGTLLIGGNVDTGEFQLSTGQVVFDQSPTGAAGVGVLRWNNTDGTLDLGLKGGNVTLQLGQENVVRVVNKAGVTLSEADFRVVKVLGAQGQKLSVNLAIANSNANSDSTIGVVTETITNNQEGFITTSGLVNNIDATGGKSFGGLENWNDGNILYLDPDNAGYMTNVKPVTPAVLVIVGYVVSASVNGKIYVKITNGYDLNELHDVNINNPLGNDLLAYNAITGFWRNVDIKEIGGVTTASPGVSNYVTKFNSSSTISPSVLLYDDGTGIGINTTATNEVLNIEGKIALNNNTNSVSIGKNTGGTGNQSVAIGSEALSLGSVANNIAIGFRSMQNTTTGEFNVSVGTENLEANNTGYNNVSIGYRSLQNNTSGANNTANGFQALRFNSSGLNNTAYGSQSLYSNTTGNSNTANGNAALRANTTGSGNVANGYEALFLNSTASGNTANGFHSLRLNTTGGGNVANGYQALTNNTTGANNTANGYRSLYSNTTGSYNTANGYSALYSNTTASYNTASGYEALLSSTTGEGNVAIGFWSLRSNITGAQNVANGYQSLYSNTTGNNNVAVGYQALRFNTTGSNNVVTGTQSLYNNTTGDSNVSNGIQSLYSNTTGNFNTANGNAALYSNTTGNNNTANGSSALRLNATGNFNTANGSSALYFNTTGSYNTANGYAALFANTTGSYNAVNGYQALFSNTSGNYNIAIGNWALRRNITGSNNVAVGDEAGATVFGGATNITPENSVFIGKGTKSGTNNDTNQIVIGYNAIGDGSNTARIGNTSTTALYVGGAAAGVVLKSPNGTAYKITVDNNGLLVTTLA